MKTFIEWNLSYLNNVLNVAIATLDKESWPVSVEKFLCNMSEVLIKILSYQKRF